MRAQDVSCDALWEGLNSPIAPQRRLHTWAGDGWETTTFGRCTELARDKAAGLRELGVKNGTPVGCVLTNALDVCTTVLGIWLAGGTVVSLPTPARGMMVPDYLALLNRLCERTNSELLLLEGQFVNTLAAADANLRPRVTAYESLDRTSSLEPSPPDSEEVAFIQFSSGTTSEPKGCAITSAAILAQLEMMAEALSLGVGETGVMWLPLSHDMGLFGGLLLAWFCGMRGILGTPQRFLRAPRTWLEDCAEFSANFTVGPSFGLKIALRSLDVARPKARIPMRAWVVGADRVEAATIATATEQLAPLGVDATSFVPAYGLAEATLAVTMTPIDESPTTLSVDSRALLIGELRAVAGNDPGSAYLVSAGVPLNGVSVRIDGERRVGEIVVRSRSLAAGYVRDPVTTANRFSGGELRTGDLGAQDGNHLYVIGRMDDILSIGGRNVHAAEVEMMIANMPGVRPGGCVLVDLIQNEETHLTVLIEPSNTDIDMHATARSVVRGAGRAGLRLAECVFVARGSLPKSPSGKVQRHRCRDLLGRDALPVVERVSL